LAVLRILLLFPIAFAIIQGSWIVAALLFIIASALDVLDGPLARIRNQVTTTGAALDPIADKLFFITTFILLGFNLLPANLFLAVIIVEIVTVLGAATTSAVWYHRYGKEPRVDANHFGKYKTVCYFIATLLLFLAPQSLTIFMASLVVYYLGLLGAILSIVAYNLGIAKT
jgi:cardiolipin synthase